MERKHALSSSGILLCWGRGMLKGVALPIAAFAAATVTMTATTLLLLFLLLKTSVRAVRHVWSANNY